MKRAADIFVLTMNPIQSRMARAALGWSLTDAARACGLGRATLARFELEQQVNEESVQRLRSAYEGVGVEFIKGGVYRGGVVPPLDGR